MLTLETRIPPPVVGAATGVAMWGLVTGGSAPATLAAWQWVVCAGLAMTGMLFDLLGLLAFRSARTTINPMAPQRSSALVTAGVYRITRNPMYVGMGLLLTAWAVALGSVWALAGPATFWLYITRFQIQPEERILKERFGSDFDAYCRRVRRWL
jgi:protein-S-isoprenylcysteine O-methyltransferase Ste14